MVTKTVEVPHTTTRTVYGRAPTPDGYMTKRQYDTLVNMVEQALHSEYHPSVAARREGFGEHLDRLAADALVQPAGLGAA